MDYQKAIETIVAVGIQWCRDSDYPSEEIDSFSEEVAGEIRAAIRDGLIDLEIELED